MWLLIYHLNGFISRESCLKLACLEIPSSTAKLAATCKSSWESISFLFVFYTSKLNRCQSNGVLSSITVELTLQVWRLINGEPCCLWFPENRILRAAHLFFVHCVLVWMRKWCRDVRARERNLSYSFHHYQLHSSPIPPYQMTLSSILAHSFPPICWCNTYPTNTTRLQTFRLNGHTHRRVMRCLN